MLVLLIFVPIVLVAAHFKAASHIVLFVLSILSIIPLACLLSRSTESVAVKTGDTVGGLLNATLGNLTELVIAITALRAGMLDLVKASIAGAVVTNSLFMLGGSFLLGGIRHHTQEFNWVSARTQTSMLLLATIALMIPSAASLAHSNIGSIDVHLLSVGMSLILMGTYVLSLFFSLKTHRDLFESPGHAEAEEEAPWPIGISVALLAGSTILIALVSEVFVESVNETALSLGMSASFVGFIVVSLVGATAEMVTAFASARRNHLDLSVTVAMGSSTQIALFVAPVLVLLSFVMAPAPMDLAFSPGIVIIVLLTTLSIGLATGSGRSNWFTGIQLIAFYIIIAITLYMIPSPAEGGAVDSKPAGETSEVIVIESP